jgi:hypothetical protein
VSSKVCHTDYHTDAWQGCEISPPVSESVHCDRSPCRKINRALKINLILIAMNAHCIIGCNLSYLLRKLYIEFTAQNIHQILFPQFKRATHFFEMTIQFIYASDALRLVRQDLFEHGILNLLTIVKLKR